MVCTKFLKGEHSFRGVGFVEVDGLLVPICGSKKYQFSVGTQVRFRDEQIDLVKPEDEVKAILRVRLFCEAESEDWNAYVQYYGKPERYIGWGGTIEGLPGLALYATYVGKKAIQMTAPFRIRMPLRPIMVEDLPATDASKYYALDTAAPFLITQYDYSTDANFYTEIFLP